MSRIFSPKFEVNSIHHGIERDLQQFSGTRIQWYLFDPATTTSDDIYDWGYGTGWNPNPIEVDVVDAIRVEGPEQVYEQGLYTRDRLTVVVSWRELERRDLQELATNVEPHLKDRFVYDNWVFTPLDIQVAGQVREWNTIVSINAVEVRPDELVNDPLFHPWAPA